MSDSAPVPAADLLSAVLGEATARLGELPAAWRSAVGPSAARSSMAVRIDDEGLVTVVCATSSWTCELQAREHEIVTALQAAGIDGARSLRCRTVAG